MDIELLPYSGSSVKAMVKNGKLGWKFTVKVSDSLLSAWQISEDKKAEAVKRIGVEIATNHPFNEPFRSEYSFNTYDSASSLEQQLGWIGRNTL